MPAALLVDLDDTLIDDSGAMARAVLELRRQHGFAQDVDDEGLVWRWKSILASLWCQPTTDELLPQAQRRWRMRRTFAIDFPDDEADALAIEFHLLYERNWEPLPGVDAFLDSTAHLPRAIVSNGHRPLALQKMERCGLTGRFMAVITPEDCGVRKPNPRIFLRAIEVLGARADEGFMVGDHFAADIEPALALGMGVFHVAAREKDRTLRDAMKAVLAHGGRYGSLGLR